jgi:glycine reductase complex component B subunit alpha and beta
LNAAEDTDAMALELRWSRVDTVVAASTTRLVGTCLEVDLDGLRSLIEADARLDGCRLDLVQPGERCRIARVFDVVAPRARLDSGEDFPGLLGALGRAGSGRTLALAGVAVVVTDQQTEHPSPLALIDMSGPAAALTELARTHNVVISARPAPGVGRSEYLGAIRLAALRAAVYLARAARETEPHATEVFDLPPATRVPAALSHLPRVAYVFQIHSHQRPTSIDEGILYGDPVRRMLPTLIHPNEILDGAVVRGFMGRAATTYAIQNHPVIRSLYAQHGRALWFAGVVLTVAQATEPERVRSACLAAGLVAHVLGADGALFTKIGGGAPHVDMAQAAAQCEALGVKTTLLVEDMSTDGTQEGMLLFDLRGLDALVNVGSAQEAVRLPAVDRVVGAEDAVAAFAGAIATTYGGIGGAIEQVGASRVMALIE